ncbi:Ig domain-containing protein [Gracilimonas sp.]|uniref:Ig domain-containing protein n=1 Tax=Gracilimonas sp. TaxID=1974203 RepID=UPI002870D608|nr:Ig domain-containing protein [Gracilimonas sp.]
MNFVFRTAFILFISLIFSNTQAQQKLMQDYSQLMDIPNVIAMEASPTHLYVLSGDEGMAVFRTYPDSLQWLYTSNGMQRRGYNIMADVRFAYLFGDSNRLTVLEPTSALGVYSSTILPEQPTAAARISNQLYFALQSSGLGKVSLASPESVDSEPETLANSILSNSSVLDLQSTDYSNQLFVLTDAPSLLVFTQQDSTIELEQNIQLDVRLTDIFIDEEEVWGSTQTGEIFEISGLGIGKRIGATNEKVQKIFSWQNIVFARTESGRVWATDESGSLQIWKEDNSAGNYIAKSGQMMWISENDKVSAVRLQQDSVSTPVTQSNSFEIKPIANQIVTFPKPLILGLEMVGNYPSENVKFSYRSNTNNAKIRKQGFYWQPTVNQIGNYWFTIVARSQDGKSDSTRFVVDVRSFNSPPRFSPIRTSSIAVNEEYTVEFSATDPDNPQNSLIRYIGVDLPEGASINEKTGEFSWTPTERQIGKTTFKVIATDRLGAATSTDVTLNVLDISRGSDQ